MAQVGTGLTFTAVEGNSTISWALTSVTVGGVSVEVLDDSTLGTSGFATKQPTELKEPPVVDIEFFYDTEQSDKWTDEVGQIRSGTSDLTLTWPIQTSGNGTNASLAGSGFIVNWNPGTATNDGLMAGTAQIQYDGKSLTYTVEAA